MIAAIMQIGIGLCTLLVMYVCFTIGKCADPAVARADRIAELDAWFDRTYPDSHTVLDRYDVERHVSVDPAMRGLFQIVIKRGNVYHRYNASGKMIYIGKAEHIPEHVRHLHTV